MPSAHARVTTLLRASSAIAVAVITTTAAAPVAVSQSRATPLQLLDVPYVSQSVELCGGAAAAMVLRYWGARGIYAESFQHLVDSTAGGIRGEDLLDAIQARGWTATTFSGDAPLIRQHLARRHPPIVLIEDRPDRFHYVVIVGWSDGRVVLHDPARAPFRILLEQDFVRAWERSDYWTLVAAPAAAAVDAVPAGREFLESPPAGEGPCAGMVTEAVRLARGGGLEQASGLLNVAARRCPADGAVWRELAGVHAIRKDWRQAAADARRALARDPGDAHAARILATSLFLEGDAHAALAAWNRTGEPVLDLVEIRGLGRTRYDVASGALALEPQRVLTPGNLRRAARRLSALPAVAGARVTYLPGADGTVSVAAAIRERPLLPTNAAALARASVRAVADREALIEVANPSGGGELWHASWRWWDARPAIAFGVAAPGPGGGVWTIVGSDERETYATGARRQQESRRRLSMGASDWVTGTVRWEGGLAVERWASGRSVALSGGVRVIPRQRIEVAAGGGRWVGAEDTWRGALDIAWRSRETHEGTVWLARGSVLAVGATAPLALWEGAGTGVGRTELLRAHPLVHEGVIRDGVFGRRVTAGTAEWRRWRRPAAAVVRVAPAIFVDTARAWRVGDLGDPRFHADVGVGLRLMLPGSGVLRADVARGLRDGRMAASIGWGY